MLGSAPGTGGPNPFGMPTGMGNDNPFGAVLGNMFKDLEQVSKEQPTAGANTAAGMPPGMDEILKNLMGGLGAASEGGEAPGMDKLMSEFTNFLKDSEGNEEMKGALDSVVNELLNKETLYEPMKTLMDEYPPWLEANWDKVSPKELESYNNQLDKITEICNFYESSASQSEAEQSKVFELLAQLQELGSPPDDLMKKIADKQFTA